MDIYFQRIDFKPTYKIINEKEIALTEEEIISYKPKKYKVVLQKYYNKYGEFCLNNFYIFTNFYLKLEKIENEWYAVYPNGDKIKGILI